MTGRLLIGENNLEKKCREGVSYYAKNNDFCISTTTCSLFFCKNSVTKDGRAGIYVINSIHCVEVYDLRMNLTGCEDVWVQATLGDKSTLVIGSVYRHPHPNFLEFSKAFNKNFLKLKAKKRFVILGDLSIMDVIYLTHVLKYLLIK